MRSCPVKILMRNQQLKQSTESYQFLQTPPRNTWAGPVFTSYGTDARILMHSDISLLCTCLRQNSERRRAKCASLQTRYEMETSFTSHLSTAKCGRATRMQPQGDSLQGFLPLLSITVKRTPPGRGELTTKDRWQNFYWNPGRDPLFALIAPFSTYV